MASVGEPQPSSNSNSPTYVKLKGHHKLAFSLLSRALEIEEKGGERQDAIPLYEAGIAELEKGLELELTEFDAPKAHSLQAHMVQNLTSMRDRVAELVSSAPTSKAEPTKNVPTSAPSSRPTGAVTTFRPVRPVVTGSDFHDPPSVKRAKELESKYGPPRPPTAAPSSSSAARASSARFPTSAASAAASPKLAPAKRQPSAGGVLKGVDSKLANIIMDNMVDRSPGVAWDDVAGLELAKRSLQELVILPSIRPELFTGLRTPARGLLLFGPPGNGKTMLAKAVASEADCRFFSISASSLMSKWVGEAEKLVRALFAVAQEVQPSIIFIDEIDSILSSRTEGDTGSSMRLKTEFLVSFDGVLSSVDDRVLVIGATNRPQELDEAVLRRLVKRIYIPCPDEKTRHVILEKLLHKQRSSITARQLQTIARSKTVNFSASDITALAKEAALGPIREMDLATMRTLPADQVRPISYNDFEEALRVIRPSLSAASRTMYEQWNRDFGCSTI
eukprot:scpid55502/ scgid4833/ Spastin